MLHGLKLKALLLGSILTILTIVMCGCKLSYQKLVPEDGVWYCEELKATLDFTAGKRVGTIYVDNVLHECTIETERFTNYIDFLEPSCMDLFFGECIYADDKKLIVISKKEPSREYTFVHVE